MSKHLTEETKNLRSLRCPFAISSGHKLITQGRYSSGYPSGAVVHYTAGRSLKGDEDALNTLVSAVNDAYCYFIISSTGTIYQNFTLDRWGSHCGDSSYPSLGKSLSTKLVGIEVCCAGKLYPKRGKWISWFGEEYNKDQVRQCAAEDNIHGGWYHLYTSEQYNSLTQLILWLRWNNPSVFKFDYVLGHDEITTRKEDPGGSLWVSMPKFRARLDKLYYALEFDF